MKTILHINKPSNSTHVLWEHLLMSVVCFVGTFAFLFFGPLMLGGKRSHLNDNNDDFSINILVYVIEHPEIQFGLSFLSVIICNIYLIYKNSTYKHVVSIIKIADEIQLGISNLRYKSPKQITLPLTHLEYLLTTKVSDSDEKSQTLRFIDNRSNKVIGIINPKHIIWNKQLNELRNALIELNQLGIKKQLKQNSHYTFGGSIFK